MSVNGSWNVTLSTPMGPQQFTADLIASNGKLTGTLSGAIGSEEITGTEEDGALAWSIKLDKPMPITIDFDVVVDGDIMGGEAKLGMFGTGKVTGQRI
ncbi:MAG: hypothetical protein ABW039_11075 [Sphingobium sp.]